MEKLQKSERGFLQGANIEDRYEGTVRVYESSNADGPHIWLAVNGSPTINKVGGNEVHLLLSLDAAEELRSQLTYLIENHYQLN